MLLGCGSFPGSNILMVECLPEVEAQPQPLLWCPSGEKSVVLLKFSLLLPDPSTCQWEVN